MTFYKSHLPLPSKIKIFITREGPARARVVYYIEAVQKVSAHSHACDIIGES